MNATAQANPMDATTEANVASVLPETPAVVKPVGTVSMTDKAAEKHEAWKKRKEDGLRKEIEKLTTKIADVETRRTGAISGIEENVKSLQTEIELASSKIESYVELETNLLKSIQEMQTLIASAKTRIALGQAKSDELKAEKLLLSSKIESEEKTLGTVEKKFSPHLVALKDDLKKYQNRLSLHLARG